ncbi:MAG TPA: 50S ribosomal protein L25 [Dehalococcoidia bacterium]|jgi:large subunit ribosomal protein L25|nr:50S ribosomal protein L25 [Dehalococcoidia bacterium]
MARKELPVETREVTGKKVAALRRSGVLPGNVYGKGLASVSIQVSTEVMEKTLKAAAANEVLDLKIGGEKETRPVVIQKVQRHPLNSGVLHAEFYQVSLTHTMRADVPLVVVGTSEAVITYNGVLMTALEALQVEALPLDLPSRIEVDITPLVELEQSLHVKDLPIPGNVTVLTDPEVMVVKISSPRVSEEEEEVAAEGEEAAEAAEGEEPTAEGESEAEASESSADN